jgi:hypothetical protein
MSPVIGTHPAIVPSCGVFRPSYSIHTSYSTQPSGRAVGDARAYTRPLMGENADATAPAGLRLSHARPSNDQVHERRVACTLRAVPPDAISGGTSARSLGRYLRALARPTNDQVHERRVAFTLRAVPPDAISGGTSGRCLGRYLRTLLSGGTSGRSNDQVHERRVASTSRAVPPYNTLGRYLRTPSRAVPPDATLGRYLRTLERPPSDQVLDRRVTFFSRSVPPPVSTPLSPRSPRRARPI